MNQSNYMCMALALDQIFLIDVFSYIKIIHISKNQFFIIYHAINCTKINEKGKNLSF